jgi:hypothetical protein
MQFERGNSNSGEILLLASTMVTITNQCQNLSYIYLKKKNRTTLLASTFWVDAVDLNNKNN